MKIKTTAITAIMAALALGVTACGDDEKESGSTSGSSSESADAKPVAEIPELTGKDTAVALDASFVEALGTLKLTPAPVGDGEISKKGVASFPITSGDVTYYKPGSRDPYVEGTINHKGSGLSLTGGGKTVELTDFVVDPGTSLLTGKVSVDGKVAAKSANLFYLDGSTLKPLQSKGSTAILEGTEVKLHEDAAGLLNETFGVDALKKLAPIGVATITVNTK